MLLFTLMASRRRGQEVADLGGRTSEQGKDYLIGTNRNANTNTKDYVPHRFQQIQIQQYQESQNALFRAGRRPIERVRLASDQIPGEAVEQTKGTGNFLLLRVIIIFVIIFLVMS